MATSDQSPPEVVRIRSDRTGSFYINLGKKLLREHGVVEYHGVGTATSLAIISAERLMKYQYGTLDKVETLRMENSNRSKVIVRVTKAATFEQAEKEFEAQVKAKE